MPSPQKPASVVTTNDKILTFNENNQLHSFNDQPAVIYPNEYRAWYQSNELNRDNDLPTQEYFQGENILIQVWSKNGRFHRTTGPAIIYQNGEKKYYYQGRETNKEFIDNLPKS